MSAPALVIRLALEESPRIYSDVRNEHEGDRLRDWIETHEKYAEVVNLAVELARVKRAA